MDNGPAHHAKYLSISDNIILLFQPIYCPEVNPIERVWQEIKKYLKGKLFNNLDSLKITLDNILNHFSQTNIASITGYDFILEALSVARI